MYLMDILHSSSNLFRIFVSGGYFWAFLLLYPLSMPIFLVTDGSFWAFSRFSPVLCPFFLLQPAHFGHFLHFSRLCAQTVEPFSIFQTQVYLTAYFFIEHIPNLWYTLCRHKRMQVSQSTRLMQHTEHQTSRQATRKSERHRTQLHTT